MRIAIDHQVTSLQDAGGMSRYHYELARHLARLPDAGGPISLDLLLGAESSVVPFASLAGSDVRVRHWRSRLGPGYPRYALNSLWTTAIAPTLGRYDVYHATYQRWEPAIRRRALVTTHHDATQERFPQLFRNAAEIRARKGKLYARADRIVCVSEAARQDLLEIYGGPDGVEAARTSVVHHGVTPALLDDQPRPEGVRTPYLLYVGSRSAYKNFPALLQAFAEGEGADGMQLVAAGGGAWSAAEQQALAALKPGVQARVVLLPRVDDAELGRLYRDATLFVYPSLYEGFGLPPLEAMTAGCPVLVSRTAALPEICGEAAHYFDPTASGDLSAQLAALLRDTALRQAKVTIGRAWAARYTWESAAMATLTVYKAAIGQAATGRGCTG